MSLSLLEYTEQLKTNNPTLTSIDFRFDDVGAEGAKTLADALKFNSILASINLLGNNDINDVGIKALLGAQDTRDTLFVITSHLEADDGDED